MPNSITPPPERVHQWHKEACKDPYHGGTFFESKTLKHIAAQAAQWGANQELYACCVLMDGWGLDGNDLMECRRPKPPTLQERALQLLERYDTSGLMLAADQVDTIRRALEALDD